MKENLVNPSTEKFRFEHNEQGPLLILGDFFAALLALAIALLIWAKGDAWLGLSVEFLRTRIPGWFYLLPLLWMVLMADSYDIRKAGNLRSTLKTLSISLIASAFIYLAVYFASEPNSLPRFGVALFLILVALFTFFW